MKFHALPIGHRRELVRSANDFYLSYADRLEEGDLAGPSLCDGWSRAQLIAHGAANALGIRRLVQWGTTGTECPMYSDFDERNQEIAELSALHKDEILRIHREGEAQLEVWWDKAEAVGDEAFSREVINAKGVAIPMERTLWMRARELYVHAIDINNGASFDELPEIILEGILEELIRDWRGHGRGQNLVLVADDSRHTYVIDEAQTEIVEVHADTFPDLVRWATGREPAGTSDRPAPPFWR